MSLLISLIGTMFAVSKGMSPIRLLLESIVHFMALPLFPITSKGLACATKISSGRSFLDFQNATLDILYCSLVDLLTETAQIMELTC